MPACSSVFGPLDVALFVEPGLQLDKDEYFLAASRGADERFDDIRAAACAIQRQSDRHDIRVVRSFGTSRCTVASNAS